jgi:hypothetical protein
MAGGSGRRASKAGLFLRLRPHCRTVREGAQSRLGLCMTRTVIVHIGAALAEIAGCFSFWMWLREIRLVLMPRMANSGQATARASFP